MPVNGIFNCIVQFPFSIQVYLREKLKETESYVYNKALGVNCDFSDSFSVLNGKIRTMFFPSGV